MSEHFHARPVLLLGNVVTGYITQSVKLLLLGVTLLLVMLPSHNVVTGLGQVSDNRIEIKRLNEPLI